MEASSTNFGSRLNPAQPQPTSDEVKEESYWEGLRRDVRWTRENPLLNIAGALIKGICWLGRQIKSFIDACFGRESSPLEGRVGPLPPQAPQPGATIDNPVDKEVFGVAEDLGTWIGDEIGDAFEKQVPNLHEKIDEMAAKYLPGAIDNQPRSDEPVARLSDQASKVFGEKLLEKLPEDEPDMSLEEAIDCFSLDPSPEVPKPAFPIPFGDGCPPVPSETLDYLKACRESIENVSDGAYFLPLDYSGPYARLPEEHTLEEVVEHSINALVDPNLKERRPKVYQNRCRFVKDALLIAYGQGPRESWKRAMTQVEQELLANSESSVKPQVHLYLDRIATLLPHLRTDEQGVLPPSYYGDTLTLPEDTTIEEVLSKVWKILDEQGIIQSDLQLSRQKRYVETAIRDLYGVGRPRPQVDTSYRDQASSFASRLVKVTERRERVRRAKEGQTQSSKQYLEEALGRLFTHRIHPPRYRGCELTLELPESAKANKEVYYQSVVKTWMKKLPKEYRSPLRAASTQAFLYESLVELYGPSSSEEKRAVRREIRKDFKRALKDEVGARPISSQEPKKNGKEDFSKAGHLFDQMGDQIAAFINEGRTMDPIKYTDLPLQIADEGWSIWKLPAQLASAGVNAVTGHNHKTAIIEQMVEASYQKLLDAGHMESLSPSKRESVKLYIRHHLYQVYGEDKRARWGSETCLEENWHRFASDSLSPNTLAIQGRPDEEKKMKESAERFVKEMMREVAKMPLGYEPQVPELSGPPLKILNRSIRATLATEEHPEDDPVWDAHRQTNIAEMEDFIMAELGNHVGQEKTRAYVRLCLAKLFNVKIMGEFSWGIEENIGKPLLGWAHGQVQRLEKPVVEAVVRDVRQNTSAIVAQRSRALIQRLVDKEVEAGAEGATLLKRLVEDHTLPMILEEMQSVDEARNNGWLKMNSDTLSEKERAARGERIADLIMQSLLPNGPQDIPAPQPGNLEALPEVKAVMDLIMSTQGLHNSYTRQLLAKVMGEERMNLNIDKVVQALSELSSEELKELEEEGFGIVEAIHAALGVIRDGKGQDTYVKAYQVFLYTILHRSIANIGMKELLTFTSDPHIQRARLRNAAREGFRYVQGDLGAFNGLLAPSEPPEHVVVHKHDQNPNPQYEALGRRLLPLLIPRQGNRPFAQMAGNKLLAPFVGKMATGVLNNMSIASLLKSSLEGTASWLQEKREVKASSGEEVWFNPGVPKESDEALEEEFEAYTRAIKDRLLDDWCEQQGELTSAMVLLGLEAMAPVYRTDPELNQLVHDFVKNTVLLMNHLASEENVLTLTERVLEDINR